MQPQAIDDRPLKRNPTCYGDNHWLHRVAF